MPWTFTFISSYAGVVEYDATSETERGARISYRTAHVEHFRQIYNGGTATYDKEQGPTLNAIRWACDPSRPIPAALLQDFNAWRAARHHEFVSRVRENPGKYGTIAGDDPILLLPTVAHAIYLTSPSMNWVDGTA